jgi:hypothetical protein
LQNNDPIPAAQGARVVFSRESRAHFSRALQFMHPPRKGRARDPREMIAGQKAGLVWPGTTAGNETLEFISRFGDRQGLLRIFAALARGCLRAMGTPAESGDWPIFRGEDTLLLEDRPENMDLSPSRRSNSSFAPAWERNSPTLRRRRHPNSFLVPTLRRGNAIPRRSGVAAIRTIVESSTCATDVEAPLGADPTPVRENAAIIQNDCPSQSWRLSLAPLRIRT